VNSLGAELYDNILIGEHAATYVQRHGAHSAPVEAVRTMSQESDRQNKPQSFDLTHHETVEELRALPDAEIERRHDAVMQSLSDDSIGDLERQIRIGRAHAYRAILEYRQSTRQSQRMEALTRSMNRLTWVVVLATIVGVAMTVWVLLSGG
jgi:cytochrome c553